MKSRGKFKKRGNQQNKSKHKKPRKTYSLYGNNKPDKQSQKRKFQRSEPVVDIAAKKLKVDKPIYSSEGEEELDDMTQLRLTFKNHNEGGKVVESSDTEESEDEENIDLGKEQENADENTSDEEEINSNHDVNKEEEHNISETNLTEENSDITPDDLDDEKRNIIEDDINEISNTSDPFTKHLFYDLSKSLLGSIQNVPVNMNTSTEEWPYSGTLVVQIPKCTEEKQERKEGTILEEKCFASAGQVPKRIHLSKDTVETIFIKPQIVNNLSRSNTSLINKDKSIPLTSLQLELYSVIKNYQDLYWPQRTFDNGEEIRYVYCLHAVNHVLKTRTKVIHHNVRLAQKDDVPEEYRDQGLVRPKVLIIVPFKNSAYKIIQLLINILITEDKGNVINKNRFLEDFTGNELIMPKKNPKPEDYEQIFAGNSSDDFKIGITVTKKSLKLYADFYSSDIIISSPLGLRYTIGAEGEPDRDYDFLASIELLIFDQAEIFYMQNWDHMLHIMKHLHLQPKESHGTDFSRVRTWSLNGWAKYYRQTLIFSSFALPEINSIFNKYCTNYAGKVKALRKIEYGTIRQVYVQLPHVFQKINANSVENSIDARFSFFTGKIVPQQREALMKQTVIYISSYFDYVKIRNYFKKEDISFVQICEYSKNAKIARARDMFFHGDAHFLLYTERHHFFNRIKIKGIRHLVFYQPPNFPHFYYEICNFMQEANMNKKIGSMSNMTVTVLYTKYDAQQLAEMVGTDRAAKMIQSEKSVHLLVTDSD